MSEKLPTEILIETRCRELGLRKSVLIKKMGYGNISKGLRRLDAICAGDLHYTQDAIQRLPTALEVPAAMVEQAVEETLAILKKQQEDHERQTFRPHAILITERTVPTSITLAAFTGAMKWKHVDLATGSDPCTFVDQVLAVIKNRKAMFGGKLPFFGATTGFAINYRFDLCITYNTDGKALDAHAQMQRMGEVTFEIENGRSALPLIRL